MARKTRKKRKYTLFDPNGDERRTFGYSKSEVLNRLTRGVGRGKKGEFKRESVVNLGWEY